MKSPIKQLIRLNSKRLALGLAVVVLASPWPIEAAGLAPRSIELGSNAQGAVTQYAVSVTTATAANIGSISFDFCTTATGACLAPTGVVTTGASIVTQAGATGFAMVDTTNAAPYITRTPALLGAGAPISYTLGNITNPTTANLQYYVRITTYTGIDGATGPVDTGTVATSTAQPVQLSGVTPELLIFCVGASITGDCSTVSGSTLDFGEFSPITTRFGTSVMQATTNAGGGYNITVNGTTMESGTNSIQALTSPASISTGAPQFGLNLRANVTPSVGADPTGGANATGTYASDYGTPNKYMFNTGDVVAEAIQPTNANTFTASYVVNIPGLQAAGVYTATMTYICTANF